MPTSVRARTPVACCAPLQRSPSACPPPSTRAARCHTFDALPSPRPWREGKNAFAFVLWKPKHCPKRELHLLASSEGPKSPLHQVHKVRVDLWHYGDRPGCYAAAGDFFHRAARRWPPTSRPVIRKNTAKANDMKRLLNRSCKNRKTSLPLICSADLLANGAMSPRT